MTYNYIVHSEADSEIFERACKIIETVYAEVSKGELLVDVDGSQIQKYKTDEGNIEVINDIYVGYVCIKSDYELTDIPYRKVDIEL